MNASSADVRVASIKRRPTFRKVELGSPKLFPIEMAQHPLPAVVPHEVSPTCEREGGEQSALGPCVVVFAVDGKTFLDERKFARGIVEHNDDVPAMLPVRSATWRISYTAASDYRRIRERTRSGTT